MAKEKKSRKSNNGTTKETPSETEIDVDSKTEKYEPKFIEEKTEQKLLEYYSKVDLIEKLKDLEKEINEREESVKKLSKEASSWKDKYTHLQAEFENAQKRWDKNRQHIKTRNTASVLKNFLSLYDSFKKAIENETENAILTEFYNQFLNILKFQGAEPIQVNINDSFDYNIHEALSSIERDDLPENNIIEIIQDGWKLGKYVLRYAKVIISKKPEPPEPESELEEPKPGEIKIEKEKIEEKKEEAEKIEEIKDIVENSQDEKENKSNSSNNN